MEPIRELPEPIDVHASPAHEFEIDRAATAQPDTPCNLIRRRIPHFAGFKEPLAEEAEFCFVHVK